MGMSPKPGDKNSGVNMKKTAPENMLFQVVNTIRSTFDVEISQLRKPKYAICQMFVNSGVLLPLLTVLTTLNQRLLLLFFDCVKKKI